MKLTKTLLILIYIFSDSLLMAQINWGPIKPNEYELSFIMEDTSIIALQNIILDNNSEPKKYEAAAKYLVYYHRLSEEQFLLNNLNTKVDSTNTLDKQYSSWAKYYIDKLVRGSLDDSNAIAGMDSIFRNTLSKTRLFPRAGFTLFLTLITKIPLLF